MGFRSGGVRIWRSKAVVCPADWTQVSDAQPKDVRSPAEIDARRALSLSAAEVDDLELLLDGLLPQGPRYLNEKEILAASRPIPRLADGTYSPHSVSLARPADTIADVGPGSEIVLQDTEGAPIAVLRVTERWPVADQRIGYLAGHVLVLRQPTHGPFRTLRHQPGDVRRALQERTADTTAGGPGKTGNRVLAVPLSAPLDGPRIAMLGQLAQRLDARLLLLPLVGGDYDAAVRRGRSATAAAAELPAEPLVVAVGLPPARGVADEHTAALVAAAYGASHVLVSSSAASAVPAPGDLPAILVTADPVVDAPTSRSVAAVLDTGRRGVTIFFTGLSGSGKSTLARALRDRLAEVGGRTVSLLDGDEVRQLLSSGLTFSRDDRDLNVRRIGYVAAEITRHGGIAICAPIAPYAITRAEVRARVEATGGDFLLVHVATPLEICERRDRKGHYARARAGLVRDFTGVSDPYEEPADADLVVDTTHGTAQRAVEPIVDRLRRLGHLAN
jgi:sulfate adenylyltransferase